MVKATKFITAKYLAAKNAGEYNGKKLIVDSVYEATINDVEKLCVRLQGVDKPVALNQTNLALLTAAFGEDTDQWINKKIQFSIINVNFNGDIRPSIQLNPIN